MEFSFCDISGSKTQNRQGLNSVYDISRGQRSRQGLVHVACAMITAVAHTTVLVDVGLNVPKAFPVHPVYYTMSPAAFI